MNYPQVYHNNTISEWLLTAGEGQSLQLAFQAFEVSTQVG